MTAAARFKQSDVARAVKAVESAGVRVGTVKIDPLGNIVILREVASAPPPTNPWDDDLTP